MLSGLCDILQCTHFLEKYIRKMSSTVVKISELCPAGQFHQNQGSPLSPALLPSAFPQVLSPLTERDRSWRLWSNFEARKRHISLKYIFRKLALFLFSSEYTKRSVVDLNFAVPPLFPFLFSVQFLPDALRSLFVQAKTQLCQNLSNL